MGAEIYLTKARSVCKPYFTDLGKLIDDAFVK